MLQRPYLFVLAGPLAQDPGRHDDPRGEIGRGSGHVAWAPATATRQNSMPWSANAYPTATSISALCPATARPESAGLMQQGVCGRELDMGLSTYCRAFEPTRSISLATLKWVVSPDESAREKSGPSRARRRAPGGRHTTPPGCRQTMRVQRHERPTSRAPLDRSRRSGWFGCRCVHLHARVLSPSATLQDRSSETAR